MKLMMTVCLVGVLATPCVAADKSRDLQKADRYAMAAKQYAAAGKPVTRALADNFARLSEFYRTRAVQPGG